MNLEAIIQELSDGGRIIRHLVAGVTQTEARIKPDPASWSILEVVCHLYDEEREDFRQRLDIALHRPGETWPVIDPEAWVTERKYNDRDLGEILDLLAEERERSLSWLKNLPEINLEAEYKDQYGSMKTGELLASWIAHDNLHMRQLVELRRTRILGMTQPYEIGYAGTW